MQVLCFRYFAYPEEAMGRSGTRPLLAAPTSNDGRSSPANLEELRDVIHWDFECYPLVMTNIAMENGHL